MKISKGRITLVALLLVAAFVLSGSTYSYWASSFAYTAGAERNPSLTIGSGKPVQTHINVTGDDFQGKVLVPEGRIGDSVETAVDKVTIEYKVNWASENTNAAKGAVDKLIVNTGKALIGNSNEYGHLINVDVKQGNGAEIKVDSEGVTIILEVTLTEPQNVTEYEAIAGKEISIPLEIMLENSNLG